MARAPIRKKKKKRKDRGHKVKPSGQKGKSRGKKATHQRGSH